jgi:adenylate cyclase
LPDRPSIAVLPFDNLSGDRGQDYFCDGITEDIITELSRFSELFVIARNSSFQYKGKAVDVRQVGRELGFRYVLEGSIRREGGRVRISAQLADAVTGAHRWAERYDRQLEDVFAVQDEVARTIVATLAAHVNKADRSHHQQGTGDLAGVRPLPSSGRQAHIVLVVIRGHRALRDAASSGTHAHDRPQLRARLRQACLDAFERLDQQARGDHLNPAALDRAYQLARRAVQLDANLPEAHAVLGQALHRRREHEAAIAEFERAMALNPNFTHWAFAEVLVCSGHPARAVNVVERHMRLDPFYVPLAPLWLGVAQYTLKQYPQALPPLRECVSRAPNLRGAQAWLAATYAQLGNIEQARAEAAELLRTEPESTIEGSKLHLFRHTRDAEHLFDGLRKAGLPER